MVESKSKSGYLAATMAERYSPSLDEVRDIETWSTTYPYSYLAEPNQPKSNARQIQATHRMAIAPIPPIAPAT